MSEHHNFGPGDQVSVWYTSGITGQTKLEGRATIVGIDPYFEDQYFVRFLARPRRLLKRYIDPTRQEDIEQS